MALNHDKHRKLCQRFPQVTPFHRISHSSSSSSHHRHRHHPYHSHMYHTHTHTYDTSPSFYTPAYHTATARGHVLSPIQPIIQRQQQHHQILLHPFLLPTNIQIDNVIDHTHTHTHNTAHYNYIVDADSTAVRPIRVHETNNNNTRGNQLTVPTITNVSSSPSSSTSATSSSNDTNTVAQRSVDRRPTHRRTVSLNRTVTFADDADRLSERLHDIDRQIQNTLQHVHQQRHTLVSAMRQPTSNSQHSTLQNIDDRLNQMIGQLNNTDQEIQHEIDRNSNALREVESMTSHADNRHNQNNQSTSSSSAAAAVQGSQMTVTTTHVSEGSEPELALALSDSRSSSSLTVSDNDNDDSSELQETRTEPTVNTVSSSSEALECMDMGMQATNSTQEQDLREAIQIQSS